MIEGRDPVPPADLLALLVGPPGIRDGGLVYPVSRLRHLCRELRLKAEPVGCEPYIPYYFGPEGLVARLHVAQVYVCEHVREEREGLVADHVPEEEIGRAHV